MSFLKVSLKMLSFLFVPWHNPEMWYKVLKVQQVTVIKMDTRGITKLTSTISKCISFSFIKKYLYAFIYIYLSISLSLYLPFLIFFFFFFTDELLVE